MLSRRFLPVVLGGVVVLVSAGVLGLTYGPTLRVEAAVRACGSQAENLQVECAFKVIEEEMLRDGIGSAMHVFSRAYEHLYTFASTGCHRYAHRVGDIAYYEDYRATKDLDAMDFPQETTACGYGFFHGFLEHLIQDHPSPKFVTEVCEYLDNRLGKDMQDIRIICYHGSGHGFTLAEAEKIPERQWGDLRRFVDEPIARCEELTQANENEVEECKQGVFNVMVDWMAEKQYGFTYDAKRPFDACNSLPEPYIHACSYEMAQKLDSASGRDPVAMAAIVRMARTKDLANVAFSVGISGIIQQTIADGRGYEETLKKCSELENDFFSSCVGSIVHGLFEHGDPQKEYEKVLTFCAEPLVRTRGFEEECYAAAAGRLLRFYEFSRAEKICKEFPAQFQRSCEFIISPDYESTGDATQH